MSKILALDIGAGTQDILFFDTDTLEHFKLVMKSPTRIFGEIIKGVATDLFVSGETMGGGPVSKALKEHAQKKSVYITPRAAATIHNDVLKVKKLGFILLHDDSKPPSLPENIFKVELGDLGHAGIRVLMEGMHLPWNFDFLVLALQDHGFPPPGISNLDFRHQFIKERIEENPVPEHFLYSLADLPPYLTRMQAALKQSRFFPAKETFIMDSGMAAILGATQDESTRGLDTFMVLDIATSHTLAAIIDQKEIAGFFEYHTRDITLTKIEELMTRLAEGNISHRQIIEEGGHGAYLRKAPGLSSIQAFIATGPKRNLLIDSSFNIHFGAPWGDNMMTGTVGLLEALRRKNGWELTAP